MNPSAVAAVLAVLALIAHVAFVLGILKALSMWLHDVVQDAVLDAFDAAPCACDRARVAPVREPGVTAPDCPHWYTEPAGSSHLKCADCGAIIDADYHDEDHS